MGGDDSAGDNRDKEQYSRDAMDEGDDNDGEEAKAGMILGGEIQDEDKSDSDVEPVSADDDKA